MQQIAIEEQRREAVVNSRSIFVTAVEDQERVRFPEEVLLVQLIATELQHHRLLKGKQDKNKVVCHLQCRDADHSRWKNTTNQQVVHQSVCPSLS